MLSVKNFNRRYKTRKPRKYVATTSNISECDKMPVDLDRLSEKANILRAFFPPPVTKQCKLLHTVNDDTVRVVAHMHQRADECEIPASRCKKLPDKEGLGSQEGRRTRSKYPHTFPDYLDRSVLEDFISEMEQASLTDSELSNATELFADMTKIASPENTSLVRSLDHSMRTRVNRYKKFSQRKVDPTLTKVFLPISPLPLKGGVLSKRLLNWGTDMETYTNLPREGAMYANLPFGIVAGNFEVKSMLTPHILPDSIREIDAVRNADIRFGLPQHLPDLRGMNVLEYIMRYCVVQSRLSTLLKGRYQFVQAWQKIVPLELLREHVDKALLQMLPGEEIEEFLKYFEFESGFAMNEEVYVKALALSIRLYGHYLKNFHSSFWMYHVSPLECIDFRHLSRRLVDIKLNPHLEKLLLRLDQIAAEQFQS